MHQHPISLAFLKDLPPLNKGLPPGLLLLLCLNFHLGPGSRVTLQACWMPHLSAGPYPRQLLRVPTPNWGEIMLLHKELTGNHQEAFSQDSSLVREMREKYFWGHCPNFNNENTHDFMDVFQCMIETAGLLGSTIYGITEAWSWWDELWQSNYLLMTLPKGLKFFRAVSPSKSPKVMGLMGIHDLDVLCHFSGMTHCPCCRKVGQNEGTIVNHLQTMHYKFIVRNVLAAHLSHWRPSATTARTAAYCQGREVPMSHLDWHNY